MGSKQIQSVSKTATWLSWVYLGILVLLPFHAFLTTWAGSNFGNLDAWRIWKELIIFASTPLGIYVAWRTPAVRTWLLRSWLPRLIFVYILLSLILGAFALMQDRVNGSALTYAWLSNLRYLGFFLLIIGVSARSSVMRRYWPYAVGIPAAIVIVFGLIQPALPYDFLRHFGYGPETIPAFQTVDNKLEYQRIQSTLRGANPLGAYLVLITALLAGAWKSLPVTIWVKVLALAALGGALILTFSRSAYLGAFTAVATVVFASVVSRKVRRYLGMALIGAMLIGAGAVVALRNNDTVQNIFFHSDETSQSSASSNTGRAAALSSGARDIVSEPLGRGPGTAGPASFRNDEQPRIAENYFLQIGQETGWLGLGLFVAINILLGRALWILRRDKMALGLFAGLLGLTVVNMLSHAWADDTLGLLFWGLAGLVVGKLRGVEVKEPESSG